MISASPIDLKEIAFIQPMGLMIGGHVTPIDHGYFFIKGAMENPPRQAAVYAPLVDRARPFGRNQPENVHTP